jgi:DNA processing protein
MNTIRTLTGSDIPEVLQEIPKAPQTLFAIGNLPDPSTYTYLTVVGTRKPTTYGRDVCEKLIKGLVGLPVVIVSGLAFGIDSIAHKAALDAGLKTIAVPGSGLDEKVLYPRTHARLANEIVERGGCLLSEFENNQEAAPWTFPQRNRIMAGLSKATLVIEAERKSGTLITSKYATDFNRDVLTIPGSIMSPLSEGPHMLIRLGATPITSVDDLREALGFPRSDEGSKTAPLGLDDIEQKIYDALIEPKDRETLSDDTDTSLQEINSTLSMLELKGVIRERMGKIERM